MTNMPTMEEMLKAGVHFGHQVSKRHPRMQPYIFGVRNGVTVIDLEQTTQKLKEALDFVRKVVSDGGLVIFVGTKRQAKDLVKKHAMDCGMPYVVNRWMGGTLTNFDVINKLIRKYKDLRVKQDSGELAKYTKKEQSSINKYLNKQEEMVGGLLSLNKIPAALFLVDIKVEATAKAEAISQGVPLVAITDSNVSPDGINYPIPANDDATRSIDLITSLIAQAAKEGMAARPVVAAPAPVQKAPAKPVVPTARPGMAPAGGPLSAKTPSSGPLTGKTPAAPLKTVVAQEQLKTAVKEAAKPTNKTNAK
ncbi:30S ribosomal protein S2 [Candidatus Uhrbacteria bacterium]|nr:30S ribosomal protein S2 [Candidatus Uhrbacteria bacterium]